jgi:putative ABC transport system permease protein
MHHSSAVASFLHADVAETDSLIPVMRVRDLSDWMMDSKNWADPRFRSTLFTAFAASALLLALAGVYGVASYTADGRTSEIGIRMALGATRRRVIGLMMFQTMRPALLGIAGGLLASAALMRLIEQYLFQVVFGEYPRRTHKIVLFPGTVIKNWFCRLVH